MPENTRNIAPLDWRMLVAEALRRRKAERLTQKEHAALASVSIPTIIAFDRGELTVSLSKAFDILRVVGLVAEAPEEGTQEAFVTQAYARWRELIAPLPQDSPGRFPQGFVRFDYALIGELKPIELHELEPYIKQAQVRHTGWPLFVTMTRPEFEPHEEDGNIECWIKPDEAGVERNFTDPAHCDFWRISPNGRAFLLRGYVEDSQETVPPGTIFDTTLPIWRMGEGLLHAAHLAKLLRRDDSEEITVRFRALYNGLSGRHLRALQGNISDFIVAALPAKSDEAIVEIKLPASAIEEDLATAVYPLVASLYERFRVANLPEAFVRAEIARFRSGRF
jgi:transcriptional regulator with XRE-family HTH domain